MAKEIGHVDLLCLGSMFIYIMALTEYDRDPETWV